jgi:two-component system nitrate/nitrite response regulator NarL
MSLCCKELREVIIVYSDEGVLGMGAADVLSSSPRFDVTLASPDLPSLIPLAGKICPDVILLDLTAGMTLGFLSALRLAAPAARIILWARQFSDELTSQAHELGGIWFLKHGLSRDEFFGTVSRISAGAEPVSQPMPAGARRVALTPREAQLITLLAQGLSNKEIGSTLGITEGTVRIYLTKLFVKAGAKHRFELAVFGLRNLNCGSLGREAFTASQDKTIDDRSRPALRSLFLVEPNTRSRYPEMVKAPAATGSASRIAVSL